MFPRSRPSNGFAPFVLIIFIFGVTIPILAKDQEFRFRKPDAESVALAGEFNGWKARPMTKGNDGTWSLTIPLSPGTYGYKFIINGKDWAFDPGNPNRKKVDGIENSAIEVKEGGSVTATPRAAATVAPDRPSSAATGPLNVSVLAERKRFDFGRSGNEHTVTTKEKWGYKVTLENNTFKALDGLEVQYRQFKFEDPLRGSSKLVASPGSTSIATLANGQKFSFDTNAVELERLELRPGWSYSDGAKAKVKDALAGLWIRIVQGGEVIFEWQNPTDLKSKAKWE